MGCVVNGPGESKHADIGISLPGTFEEPVAPVFIDGRLDRTLRGDGLVAEFIEILEEYVARRYPTPSRSADARAGLPVGDGGRQPVWTPRDLASGPLTASSWPPVSLEASTRPGVYSAPTERPLRDVGDPHVSF